MKTFIFFLFVAVFFPLPVHAYFDPGTGSMLIQVAVGAIAGIAVFWRKIKTFIMSLISRKKTGEDKDDDKS